MLFLRPLLCSSRQPALRRHHLSSVWRILLAIIVCAVTGSAFATTTISVYINAARAGHSFTISSSNGDGSWSNGGFAATGAYSVGQFSFEADPNSPDGSYYLLDQTVGDYLCLDGFLSYTWGADLSTSQWVDGNGQPSPRRFFIVSPDQGADTFVLHSDGGVFYPVNVTSQSGYVELSALADQGSNFTLIDLTTGKQLAANSSNGWDTGNWFNNSVTIPFVNVYAIVPDTRLGYTFGLTSSSYYASIVAASLPIPSLGGLTRTVVSAFLPMQAGFDLSLSDWDTSYTGSGSVGTPFPFEQVFDFTSFFPAPPPPPPNWGWYDFTVGENHFYDGLYVAFSDTWAYAEDTGMGGFYTSWDDYGNPVDYNYRLFRAWIDLNYTPTVLPTAQSDLMDGFHPWHPSPPAGYLSLSVIKDRLHDTIHLQQDDATTWAATVDPNYEWANLTYHVQETIYIGTPDEQTVDYDVPYAILTVPYDPAQGATILDLSLQDSIQPAIASGQADLSHWFPASAPLQLNISLSRLGHDFEIHTSRGSIYPVHSLASEGYWPSNYPSFVPYYYFHANADFDPSFDWWLFDKTTNTASPHNRWDYSDWTSDSPDDDLDGDGLPDWYETYILHTSTDGSYAPGATHANGWDTDHDGLSDREELVLGTSLTQAAVHDSTRLVLTVFTPLQ